MTKMKWYKGNIHTHTTKSDGDEEPSKVVRWFRRHGYDFLVLSDHNHLTLFDYAEGQRRFKKPLMIPGEEVSAAVHVDGRRIPIHINGIGISRVIEPVDTGVEVRLVILPVLVPRAVLVGGKAEGLVLGVQRSAQGLEQRRQVLSRLRYARLTRTQAFRDVLNALVRAGRTVATVSLVVKHVTVDPLVRRRERHELLCQSGGVRVRHARHGRGVTAEAERNHDRGPRAEDSPQLRDACPEPFRPC